MKQKGMNEAYRGQALDRWKINKCCNTDCKECTDKKLSDVAEGCPGRYAL